MNAGSVLFLFTQHTLCCSHSSINYIQQIRRGGTKVPGGLFSQKKENWTDAWCFDIFFQSLTMWLHLIPKRKKKMPTIQLASCLSPTLPPPQDANSRNDIHHCKVFFQRTVISWSQQQGKKQDVFVVSPPTPLFWALWVNYMEECYHQRSWYCLLFLRDYYLTRAIELLEGRRRTLLSSCFDFSDFNQTFLS